jgi:hypothetical protein
MAAKTPDIGSGTTLTFQSGFCAKVLELDVSGIKRASVETTTLETTTAKAFMPSDLYDPGDISLTMQFKTDATPPINTDASAWTITWPDGETMLGSGFLTDYDITCRTEEVMTAKVTIKNTGAITW